MYADDGTPELAKPYKRPTSPTHQTSQFLFLPYHTKECIAMPHSVAVPLQITRNRPHAEGYTKDSVSEIKATISAFLQRSGYKTHRTPPNALLRNSVSQCMLSWDSDDDPTFIGKLVDSGCSFAETGYGHTSFDHQYYIALYTALILYVDDIGNTYLEAVGLFASRFARGEKQPLPALEELAGVMRRAHDLFTLVGGDAIISGTLDAITAMYIEFTTKHVAIKPQATWYPYYLRTRSGICPPYIHFIFMNSWRATTESYLQVLPYMERWVVGANDILSFYKEEVAGETWNYIHMLAKAEEKSAVDVLGDLVNEVLNCTHKVETLIADDCELTSVWQTYVQRVLEFHINTKRYRLSELDF